MKLTRAQRTALASLANDPHDTRHMQSRVVRRLRTLGLLAFGEAPSLRTGIMLHGYLITDAGRATLTEVQKT